MENPGLEFCLAELEVERARMKDILVDKCVCSAEASDDKLQAALSACEAKPTQEEIRACKRAVRQLFKETQKQCDNDCIGSAKAKRDEAFEQCRGKDTREERQACKDEAKQTFEADKGLCK